jgi:hypothetical protein
METLSLLKGVGEIVSNVIYGGEPIERVAKLLTSATGAIGGSLLARKFALVTSHRIEKAFDRSLHIDMESLGHKNALPLPAPV